MDKPQLNQDRFHEFVNLPIRQFPYFHISIFPYSHIVYFFGSGAVPVFLLRCQRFCWNGFVVSSFFAASVAAVS